MREAIADSTILDYSYSPTTGTPPDALSPRGGQDSHRKGKANLADAASHRVPRITKPLNVVMRKPKQ